MSTKIEWTDETWNPVTGCTKVSEGCDHCYIDRTPPFRMEGRKFVAYCHACAGHGIIDAAQNACPDCRGTGEIAGKTVGATTGVRLHPERLKQPLHWRKPRRVFVNSLSDLFHADVSDAYIARVFAVMANAPRHTFQVLTKRPGRMRSLLRSADFWAVVAEKFQPPDRKWSDEWRELSLPLPNVWLGTSVENQKWADIRIPQLLDTPAAVRFLSCEPLLGPLILNPYLPAVEKSAEYPEVIPGLDWVIVGGESGANARPMHPDWARSLRDQCTAARVPFFFKQWGEWAPWTRAAQEAGRTTTRVGPDRTGWMARVGKRSAGRELDGRTWDEYPGGWDEGMRMLGLTDVIGIEWDAAIAEVRSQQPQAPAGARRLADICFEHARLHPAPTSDDGSNQ